MVCATLIFLMVAAQALTPTSSFRAQFEQNAFDDSSSQDKDDVLRESLESFAQPAELAKANPLAVNPVGGVVQHSGPGHGSVPRASPAGVIPNEAALKAVKDAHQDAQLQKGLYGGLLNNQGSEEGRHWTGGALFKEGDKVLVTDLVAKDNPWAAGKEGTVVPGRPADGDPDRMLVTFGSDHSAWFKASQLKHDEDIPALQGDFEEGDKVMVTDLVAKDNPWAASKEGTIVPGRPADGDPDRMLVTFGSDHSAWFKPSQLKHSVGDSLVQLPADVALKQVEEDPGACTTDANKAVLSRPSIKGDFEKIGRATFSIMKRNINAKNSLKKHSELEGPNGERFTEPCAMCYVDQSICVLKSCFYLASTLASDDPKLGNCLQEHCDPALIACTGFPNIILPLSDTP